MAASPEPSTVIDATVIVGLGPSAALRRYCEEIVAGIDEGWVESLTLSSSD